MRYPDHTCLPAAEASKLRRGRPDRPDVYDPALQAIGADAPYRIHFPGRGRLGRRES